MILRRAYVLLGLVSMALLGTGTLPTTVASAPVKVPDDTIGRIATEYGQMRTAPGSFVSGTTLAKVQHTYSHVGHYHIRLTWRDQTGLSNDDNSLVVKVLPPQAIHCDKKK